METDTGTGRRRGWIGAAAALAILVALPFVASGYWVRVLTGALMYCVFTQGINIIAGYAGYPAFGNVVFFGIGAYGTGLLMSSRALPFAVALPLAAVAAAAVAGALGPAILRLRGGYFAIATLGVMLAVRDLVNTADFTGGSSGLRLAVSPLPPAATNRLFYFLMAGLMLAGTGLTWWIARSKFGYGLRAIRESVEAAEVLGVDTVLYRVAAWCISAVFAAAAGGVYAYWAGFLEPQYAFDIMISIKGFLMMILGGGGTVFGPLVGALFFELFSEVVWGQFLRAHLFVLGIVMMLVAMYVPDGIQSLLPSIRAAHGKERGGRGLAGTR